MTKIHRLVAILLFVPGVVLAQGRITTPKEEFGSNFGDDYFLASYKQIAAYCRSSMRNPIAWWCRR